MKDFIIDLQLFSYDGMSTANIADRYQNTSSSELARLSPEFKEYWSNYLIKLAGPNLVYAQFGEKEEVPKKHGDTAEWRKWNNFGKASISLVEGVTPNKSNVIVDKVRVQLKQYGNWAQISDLLQEEAIDNVLVEITRKFAENAKLTLDTVIREHLISDCERVAYSGTAEEIAEVKDKISAFDVSKLATFLRNNNAPKFDGSYVCIVHPSIIHDLMTDTNWIDINKYSNASSIFEGEAGKLYGVRFIDSTESKVVKASKFGSGTAASGSSAPATYASESSTHTLTFPANTLAADDFGEGDKFWVTDGTHAEEVTVSSVNQQVVTIGDALSKVTGTALTAYNEDSAMGGRDYFVCFFLGKGAYKVTALGSGNAEMIVKPLGSGEDPLNQRMTAGWKINGFAAKIVIPEYCYEYCCVSGIEGVAAN